jgi:uncharacterized membrane protein
VRSDVLFTIGGILVLAGLWFVFYPLALIALGAFLIFYAWQTAPQGPAKKEEQN